MRLMRCECIFTNSDCVEILGVAWREMADGDLVCFKLVQVHKEK